MEEMKLATVESRFADIIWENAPISSGTLAKLCEKELEWKRTTTYTVLKRLCQRGIFQNVDGVVTACLSREEFYTRQGHALVEEAFGGSLPAFISAFTKGRTLTPEEIAELKGLVDRAGEV